MKIDRLIGIITILLQKDKITAPELAKRFEVSRRTINRDIEDISKAGIPIVTIQGSGGGISILDSYKMDKALLNDDELQAIFSESEKYRLIEEYGVNCYKVIDSGELLLERDFANYDNMRSWIFSFGDKVTILEPMQLREDRKKQAAAILKMKG